VSREQNERHEFSSDILYFGIAQYLFLERNEACLVLCVNKSSLAKKMRIHLQFLFQMECQTEFMKEKKTITGHDNKHAKKDKKKIDPSQAGLLGKARSKQIFRGEGEGGKGGVGKGGTTRGTRSLLLL